MELIWISHGISHGISHRISRGISHGYPMECPKEKYLKCKDMPRNIPWSCFAMLKNRWTTENKAILQQWLTGNTFPNVGNENVSQETSKSKPDPWGGKADQMLHNWNVLSYTEIHEFILLEALWWDPFWCETCCIKLNRHSTCVPFLESTCHPRSIRVSLAYPAIIYPNLSPGPGPKWNTDGTSIQLKTAFVPSKRVPLESI
jgi:hypothetical protein